MEVGHSGDSPSSASSRDRAESTIGSCSRSPGFIAIALKRGPAENPGPKASPAPTRAVGGRLPAAGSPSFEPVQRHHRTPPARLTFHHARHDIALGPDGLRPDTDGPRPARTTPLP